MKSVNISVPFTLNLTDENAWSTDNNKSYSVMRCHFVLRERFLNESHQVGDALAVYKSPKGVGAQHVLTTSFELEQVQQVDSIEKYLVESDFTQKFVTEVSAKMGVEKTFGVSAKHKQECVEKLKSSISVVNQITESCKVRKTTEFTITNTIDPDVTESIVAVPVYKRKAFDVILSYVDYLHVDYVRTAYGLRKKAQKSPQITDPNKHPNRIKFGIPLATIKYWEFLPKSSVLMLEKEHVVQVEDSEEFIIDEPVCHLQKVVEFPPVPTLYQIANAAFPLKWIGLNSLKKDWTVEELHKIELDEVKGKGWWNRHRKVS
ncbi:hypothetical protein [Vibrio hyugaensis]|uniref:hypothetical protein n=1 Tax=Vibrio hyugaensis TaxID=1534743 RepID=UPI000CE41970|nr:hypothetical protein [Vibrio hyugaensis]